MRIALVEPPGWSVAPGLRDELRRDGHTVEILDPAAPPDARGPIETARTLADDALRRRGFATPLAGIPAVTFRLLLGDYEVAHALSITGAAAALAWRRLAARPVVFTAVEPVTRATLADRRLRLRLVRQAFEAPDAVAAGGPAAQAAARRWLAIDLPVIELDDAASYLELYRAMLAARQET